MFPYLLLIFCMLNSYAQCSYFFLGPHRLTGFGEADYIKRKREGGTNQKGTLLGFGIDYERFKDFGFYLFGEAYETHGTLKGSTGGEVEIKSRFSAHDYFGRLGWSLSCYDFYFAPFCGGGYAYTVNRFIRPSPLHVSMKIHYPYALTGLKIEWRKSEKIHIFTSLQLDLPFEPKCTIENDPDFFTTHQTIKKELQTDFQIGIRWQNISCLLFNLNAETLFLYRHNHFGEHDNYPFNFLDTTHQMLGLRVQVSFLF